MFVTPRIRFDSAQSYLSALGTELTQIAILPQSTWHDFAQDLFITTQLAHITRLQQRLEESGKQRTLWGTDMRAHIADLQRNLHNSRPWQPAEFRQFGTQAEALFREYLQRCGELFCAWLELWQAHGGAGLWG
jgi:hypothetical protein